MLVGQLMARKTAVGPKSQVLTEWGIVGLRKET